MQRRLLIVLAMLMLVGNLWAKRFTNQYTEFELPPGWNCDLEGSEYVCQSTNDARRKEAIIILAAKIRGEKDDLDQYQAYLNQNKTYTLPGGKRQVSEPKYTKMREINGHRWVDSLHLASEVPGFYTRYLATVKEDLGVAVTFSVSKQHYDAYASVFDKIIESLRVFRQKKVDLSKYRQNLQQENVLDNVTYVEDDLPTHDLSARKRKRKSGQSTDDVTLYGLLALAAVGFIIYKKRKGKKGGNKKKSKKKKK